MSLFFDCFKDRENGAAKALSHVEDGHIDPNCVDEDGTCALSYATMGGYVDLMEALIKKGADLDKRSKEDQGPLFLAGSCNCVFVLVCLRVCLVISRLSLKKIILQLLQGEWIHCVFLSNMAFIPVQSIVVKMRFL